MDCTADVFEAHRTRLFGIARRMLGTSTDAEDVLQDAYLRWHETTSDDIQSPAGFLVTVTTRLCLDRLRHWKRCREQEAMPWLAAPELESYAPSPEDSFEMTEDVSAALMTVVERLGPAARAAFLLREVFDYDYPEVAELVGKSESACRQLIHRSRAHLREPEARFSVTPECRERLLRTSLAAMGTGDRRHVMAMLAEEVEYADTAAA